MHWYIINLIYQVICGDGVHKPQFDEQLRLIEASSEEDAIEKASAIGFEEEETFINDRQQLVQWKFINISEIYPLEALATGAEILSRIKEVEDADLYIKFVNYKARQVRDKYSFSLNQS